MYALVLLACVTFEGETHCQAFERDYQYSEHSNCMIAASIERGRYTDRIEARKEWLAYEWECREV